MVEIVKPNPEAVEQAVNKQINAINATHAEIQEELLNDYNNQRAGLNSKAQDEINDAQEKKNAVIAKNDKIVEAKEALVDSLKRQLAAAKDNLSTAKTNQKQEKKSAVQAFKKAAKDTRKRLDDAIQIIGDAYHEGYNRDVATQESEVDAQEQKVKNEKSALRAYKIHQVKTEFTRVVNGVAAVIDALGTVYQKAHDQDPNVSVSDKLKNYVKKEDAPQA